MLQPGQLMVHFVLMSNTLLFYVFKLFCWFRYILKHYKIVAKYLFIFTSSQWPLLQCLGDLFDLVTSPGVPLLWVSPCQRHDVTHWAWCSNEAVKYIQAVTSFNWEMYLQRWERNFSWTESTTIDFMGYWWFLTIQSMSPEQIHAQDCRIDFRILWRIVILFVQISIPAQYKWNKT